MIVKSFFCAGIMLTQLFHTNIQNNHKAYQKDCSQQDTIFASKRQLLAFQTKYKILNEKKLIETIKANKNQLQVKVGDTADWILPLKKNLYLLGDLKVNDKKKLYDSSLFFAIASFQERHGMKITGNPNVAFIQEMNIPIENRLQQIKANIERDYEMEQDSSNSLIVINIPEFKLHIMEKGTDMWKMNIIVGKKNTPTVEFNNYLQYIVFCPYWNVPESIYKNELDILIRKDKHYLTNHHMEWIGNILRQKPGIDNPLGSIKFLFPNKYNIYMHDTPIKTLFNKENRSFSHGCIRLAEAKKLALYILGRENNWSEKEMQQMMECTSEKYYKIKVRVPIKIIYATSWVDQNGRLQFRKDLYKKFEKKK